MNDNNCTISTVELETKTTELDNMFGNDLEEEKK